MTAYSSNVRGYTQGRPRVAPDPDVIYARERPADWPTMIADEDMPDHTVEMLVRHRPGKSAFAAVAVTGVNIVATVEGVQVAGPVSSINTMITPPMPVPVCADGFQYTRLVITGDTIRSFYRSAFAWSGITALDVVEMKSRLPAASQFSCPSSVLFATILDMPGVTSLSNCFAGNKALKVVRRLDAPNATRHDALFSGCRLLEAVPWFDASHSTRFDLAFSRCFELTGIPDIETGNVTLFSACFSDCTKLFHAPRLDTHSGTDFSNMFAGCRSITSGPEYDLSSATTVTRMFTSCVALKRTPPYDLTLATTTSEMFSGCLTLQDVGALTTPNAVNMQIMFTSCYSMAHFPAIDLSSCVNASQMFSGCYSLPEVPDLDLPAAQNLLGMFSDVVIPTIGKINAPLATNFTQMFQESRIQQIGPITMAAATNATGMLANCTPLKQLLLDPSVTGWSGCNLSVTGTAMLRDQLVTLFESLPTLVGEVPDSIDVRSTPGLPYLTPDDIAIATAKGWTIITA
ncbi:MAG: DUF285 domain-containing protein [Bifidobacteriaceae bacterium]|jgi:hypothetical protein|nr:DUF285 domain-containing protein [Bifidobacteriaceae bacterium]